MLEWPILEARRDQSSLLLFHKIHCGAVSIEKDKYMTPAHSLKTTRSSHSAQYRRHQTYSDALKNFFLPRTIPHWNSLPPSVANTQSAEEFRALLIGAPQGFWGSGVNGYLFSGSWGALLIIFRDLGSKLIVLGI